MIYLSPKTGRPRSLNPKCHDIKVRFDDAEYERIISYCSLNSLSIADFMRLAVKRFLDGK